MAPVIEPVCCAAPVVGNERGGTGVARISAYSIVATRSKRLPHLTTRWHRPPPSIQDAVNTPVTPWHVSYCGVFLSWPSPHLCLPLAIHCRLHNEAWLCHDVFSRLLAARISAGRPAPMPRPPLRERLPPANHCRLH